MWKSIFLFVLIITLCACGEEGAEDGTLAASCVQTELVTQCPPNTVPNLQADSNALCSQATSVRGDAVSGDVEVTNYCVGSGGCVLACELVDPCPIGIERVSATEGVICIVPDSGCGNGTCGAGENPDNCPEDCARDCVPNSARCSEGYLERCSANGMREDPVACGRTERCEEIPNTDPPNAQCISSCGDGEVQEPEECDDGNSVDDDGCANDCTLGRCGDGEVQAGEECDDGNTETEVCDYGLESCQICSSSCRLVDGQTEYCGDGIEQPQEQCDDGNSITESCDYGLMSCQICNDRCQLTMGEPVYCGDGTLTEDGGETCDEGDENANNGSCTSDCQTARCGDGHTRADIDRMSDPDFEYCDDANSTFFDGCNEACEHTERYDPLNGETCARVNFDCDPDGDDGQFNRLDGKCYSGLTTGGGDNVCVVKNSWPLQLNPETGRREGMIQGRLINGTGKLDLDLYTFEALCGFESVTDCPNCECLAESSAKFRVVIDFERPAEHRPGRYYDAQADYEDIPFRMTQSCNGNCTTYLTPDPPVGFCRRDQLYDIPNRGLDCRGAGQTGLNCRRLEVCRYTDTAGYQCVPQADDECGGRCPSGQWCRADRTGRYTCQRRTIRDICRPTEIPSGVERAYSCIDANTVGEYGLSLNFSGRQSYPIEYTIYIEEVLGEEVCDWPKVSDDAGRNP